ncbi:exported hypothetical protein [Xenorhabdus bovienii str. oregonense]|uniref:Uncharacterized protein n=1 Tax=Xenorhabdus bovienii str. oregonense TaxID=1398202 RepID=A0A077PDS2_XENBV|nr:hypothetical protein [Xenorhabdus bovienii]CDH07891.1 exported hypothetical protein [Xenorhabdus bovienii str. oregonense]
MGSFKISIKNLVIAITLMAIFFAAGYGLVNDKAKENVPLTREELLKESPSFEAINKIDPVKAEELYKIYSSTATYKDEKTKNEVFSKFVMEIRVWFNSNLGNLLGSASDAAVNDFGQHNLNVFNVMLDSDPSGVHCFNVLYPGVLGNIEASRLEENFKKLALKVNYLNSIADSIAQEVKVDRLPVEQVEEALSIINNKLFEKYGVDYYIEDPKELAKQPALECKSRRDFYKQVMELDPHFSAEVIRYINTVK